MKSVFWIHSHITFIITSEIIKRKKLDDIVLIVARNYHLPYELDCKRIRIYISPFCRHAERNNNLVDRYNPFQTRINVKKCCKFYENILGNQNFQLFIPTSFEHAIALLISMNNCKSYYYIEEGMAAYICNQFTGQRNYLYRIASKYIYNVPPMGFYYITSEKFCGTIGFSSQSFSWSPNNEIINLSWQGDKKYNESHLLVLGLLKETTSKLVEIYTKVCSYFETLGDIKVYFKFHPSTKLSPEKALAIINVFKKSKIVEFQEINDDTILEFSFAYTNSTIYSVSNCSSVQLYLSLFNCKIKELSIKDNRVVEKVKNYNEIISEQCQRIKL